MNLDIPPLRPHQRRATFVVGLWLAVPLVAIVATLLLAASVVVWRSVEQLDSLQRKNELTLAKTAFDVVAQPAMQSIEDYSSWDETYDNTLGKIDLAWTTENLGPWLIKGYGLTHVLVLDENGTLRYAAIPGKNGPMEFVSETAPDVAGLLPDGVRQISARVLAAARGGDMNGQQGYISYLGQATYLAARAIRPNSVARLNRDKPVRTLILLKVLEEADIAKIGASYGLINLQVSNDPMLALAAPGGGRPELGFSWSHLTVGKVFVSKAVFELLPYILVASVMMILSIYGWSHAFGIIQKAEMDALDERAKSVQETARAKAFFVANMSHELRTPLNAIIGFSEVIKNQMFGTLNVSKYVEYAADIHASGNHLLGIVNNILTLSKIDAQHQTVSIEPVRIAETIGNALRMVQPDAAKRQIGIVQTLTDAPLVSADTRALTQIVVNLMSNAAKFSHTGGTVRVCVTHAESEGMVELSVCDQGCGIPPAILAQLGRPFTQAEDPLRRNFQGTGLGLSICFALARQMNCDLRIESEVGVGTTATLAMPIAISANERCAEPSASPAQNAA